MSSNIKIVGPSLLLDPIKIHKPKQALCVDCQDPLIKAHHTTVVVLRSQRIATHLRASFCDADCQENWWTSGGSHWEHYGLNDPYGMYDVHTFETDLQMRAARAIGHFLQIFGFDETAVHPIRLKAAQQRGFNLAQPQLKDLHGCHPFVDRTAIFHETDQMIEMGVFDIPAGSGYFSVGVPGAEPDRRLVERYLHPEPWSLNAWWATPSTKVEHRDFRALFRKKVWGG